jgi:hypothetical protein
MPNKWTFQMQSIKSLLQKYNVGKGWIDPFAGMASPAEFRNDLNPNVAAEFNLKADDFINQLKDKYVGILFDPPYSLRQVKECYESYGLKFTQYDTQECVRWNKLRDIISEKILPEGYAINFGWNSSGFGNGRGFEIIEILLVCHGGAHNDTIVTVEQKINQGSLF